jgi:oligopeptide transport system substrate-binding protein
MIVTEVIELEGETRIITRVVRQTLSVTATPEPVATPNNAPAELDISFLGTPPNIDPQQAVSPAGIDLLENLFVGLTNFNHIHNTVEPELAQSWEVSRDGRVWTFHLRDDVFWVRPTESPPGNRQLWPVTQVRPVVADDMVYAIQRACDRTTGTPDAFVLFIIEGCEPIYMAETTTGADLKRVRVQALDDYTLEIALTQPASQFLTMTTLPLFHPVPREIVEELNEEWLLPQNLLTSGPFMPIPGGSSETRLVLHRNEQWPIRRGGNVDIVNVFYLDEEMDIYDLWQDKLLDLSPLPDSEQEAFMVDTPLKAKLLTAQTVFYLGYNFDSAVFREAEMRRAFGAAINREDLVEAIAGDQGLPMRHLTAPGAVGNLPYDEVGEGYSPDYAAQQINASGFTGCSQMPPIRFLVSTSDISLQRAEIIRDMWQETLGCPPEQIIIEQAQFGTLLANTRQDSGELRPDVWELGWAAYYPDAHNWLGDLLHCNESENRQNRPCSEVDDLIRQAANTPDTAARVALYREIENMFFGRDGLEPITPLYVPGELVLAQSWLGYVPAIFGGEQYDTYLIDENLKRLERSRQ